MLEGIQFWSRVLASQHIQTMTYHGWIAFIQDIVY